MLGFKFGVIVCLSLFAISYVASFFTNPVCIEIDIPKYDYIMELTYADGSKRVITDYANDYSLNREPKIESPIFHKGYYVELNGEDYYGVVALKCIKTSQSKHTQKVSRGDGLTRYNYYTQRGCPLLNAMFSSNEYLLNKKYQFE